MSLVRVVVVLFLLLPVLVVNAQAQEVLVLRGHTNGVLSAAYSPDGRFIITASSEVQIWASGNTSPTGSADGEVATAQAVISVTAPATATLTAAQAGQVAQPTGAAVQPETISTPTIPSEAVAAPVGSPTPVPSATVEAITCPGALQSRLVPGGLGRVIDDGDNRSNRMRNGAGLPFGVLTSIPEGETFVVLEGPTCADGYAWWRVNYSGVVGWTVESDSTEYWIEPLAPSSSGAATQSTCEVTALQGVNLRAEASTTSVQLGSRAANTLIIVNGQTLADGGFIWWRVGDGSSDDGLWVREDLVREGQDCEFLPLVP